MGKQLEDDYWIHNLSVAVIVEAGCAELTVTQVDDQENNSSSTRHLQDSFLFCFGCQVILEGSIKSGREQNRCNRKSSRLVALKVDNERARSSPKTAITSSELFICAAVSLNPCSEYLIPPTKKTIPRTRSKFERIDPSNDDWTTWISHLTRAIIATISSTALPRVALRTARSSDR